VKCFAILQSPPRLVLRNSSTGFAFEAAWSDALGACGIVPEMDAAAAQSVIKNFKVKDFSKGSDRDGLPVPALVAAIHVGATS